MNVKTFDKLGTTGYNLVIDSLDRIDELAEQAKGIDKGDYAAAAKNMAEMTRTRTEALRGMYFVKAHRDLTESLLALFGIGCRCNCRC